MFTHKNRLTFRVKSKSRGTGQVRARHSDFQSVSGSMPWHDIIGRSLRMANLEVTRRWYVGRGAKGESRIKHIERIAALYFQGSVSKLVNDSINKRYNLNPETGEPLKPLPPPTPPPQFPE